MAASEKGTFEVDKSLSDFLRRPRAKLSSAVDKKDNFLAGLYSPMTLN